MDQLKLVPDSAESQKLNNSEYTTYNAGTHDTMRYGPRSFASEIGPRHPLEHHLQEYEATQQKLNLTMQRNVYGLHAPVRLMMERSLVGESSSMHTQAMSSGFMRKTNVHLDILTGQDETLDVKDVLIDRVLTEEAPDVRELMEKKLHLV